MQERIRTVHRNTHNRRSWIPALAATGVVFGISLIPSTALAATATGWGIGEWGSMVWGASISAVPAMNGIGLLALGGLLAGAGAYATRRRNAGAEQGITR